MMAMASAISGVDLSCNGIRNLFLHKALPGRCRHPDLEANSYGALSIELTYIHSGELNGNRLCVIQVHHAFKVPGSPSCSTQCWAWSACRPVVRTHRPHRSAPADNTGYSGVEVALPHLNRFQVCFQLVMPLTLGS